MNELASVDGFKIVQKLGSGGYGEIYAVKSHGTNELYALKTENIDSINRAMQNEIEILKSLPPSKHFPSIVASGSTSAVRYFVMPLYGPSLSSFRHLFDGERFSLSTVLKAAVETIEILESLHKCGVVHCDIKPSNFLINQKKYGGFVLIDYGLSSCWKVPGTNSHIEQKTSNGFRGTLKYASINVHKMIEPTRRDDVISWFYSFVELYKGKLPWKDVRDHSLSMSCKQTISSEKLCSGMPTQFQTIYEVIKDIEFDAEPNYQYIKDQLKSAMRQHGVNSTTYYDWDVQRSFIGQLTPYPELFDRTTSETSNKQKKNNKIKKCEVY